MVRKLALAAVWGSLICCSMTALADIPGPGPRPERPRPRPMPEMQLTLSIQIDPDAESPLVSVPMRVVHAGVKEGAKPASATPDSQSFFQSPGRTLMAGLALSAGIVLVGVFLFRSRLGKTLALVMMAGGGLIAGTTWSYANPIPIHTLEPQPKWKTAVDYGATRFDVIEGDAIQITLTPQMVERLTAAAAGAGPKEKPAAKSQPAPEAKPR